MITTLDLHERRVQDELILLMRDELGYRYMGKMDIDCQVFDTMGRIQKSMVGKTVKMDNKNIDAPRLSEFLKRKGWSEAQRSQAYHTLHDAAMCHTWKDLYDANQRVWNLLTSFCTWARL